VSNATASLVRERFLLPADRRAFVSAAQASNVLVGAVPSGATGPRLTSVEASTSPHGGASVSGTRRRPDAVDARSVRLANRLGFRLEMMPTRHLQRVLPSRSARGVGSSPTAHVMVHLIGRARRFERPQRRDRLMPTEPCGPCDQCGARVMVHAVAGASACTSLRLVLRR